ncbi:MAG: excisionase [Defluviitaleaceae bacterium]|nr:excisionase [Defluviitaleaceae bacterium]
MDYTLMHKNIPVADMVIDETGFIAKVPKVHDERHLPVRIFGAGIDRKALNDWWLGRSIPASRDGLQSALEVMGLSSPTLLIEKCFGLSLSDQYWIAPKNSELKWENINFFTNDFSKDVGEALFGKEPTEINFASPDNTSDGWLKKKWIISDGKRVLMKGGSGVFQQEPFNEVISTIVMKRLNVAHIEYTLTFDGEKPFSLCENFVTPDTELVPAWRVKESLKKSNSDSHFTHFLRCCDESGIANVQSALNKMLTIDYIIANEDRHYNNFGFLRNAETLEWQGFAPIYDSGTSLWHNSARVGSRIESKPFYTSHDEQLKLVQSLKWFDRAALDGVDAEIISILAQSPDIDEARQNAIAAAVLDRVGRIEQLSQQKPSLDGTLQSNRAKVKPRRTEQPAVLTKKNQHEV